VSTLEEKTKERREQSVLLMQITEKGVQVCYYRKFVVSRKKENKQLKGNE